MYKKATLLDQIPYYCYQRNIKIKRLWDSTNKSGELYGDLTPLMSIMTIGRIMNDGRIMDRSNMMIGKVESDGYVKDRSNMTVGRIKPDGYVVDRSNMTIGRAKGIPITYAAVYFFFNKFGY